MATLDGNVAIITGASQGIGRGEALALAKEGANLVLLARTLENVEKVAAEVRQIGGKAIALSCDVSKRQQVDFAVESALETYGKIDILINNAQAIPFPHPLESWTEVEERQMWESGYLGSWNFMQACFPHMKGRGYGRIINTVSSSGYSNLTGFSGYGANKEAVRALTRSAAREWGSHGITVNAISPAVLTPFVEENFPDEESKIALLRSGGVVIERWGDAEADAGRAVVYLVGPDAGYITGCTLSVDGGAAMLV